MKIKSRKMEDMTNNYLLKIFQHQFRIQILFLVLALTLLSPAVFARLPRCEDLFSGSHSTAAPLPQVSPLAPKPLPIRLVKNIKRWWFQGDTRDLRERPYNYLSDYDYLREKRVADKLGVVRSVFSKKYDTRIYYTATGVPDSNGDIPLVDPRARALYFYFHGSGTDKASGVNFSYKMNKLAALGYAVISIDLPYHADGSRNRRMSEPEYFYGMLNQLINEYRVAGMPIYLAGHSYGPEIAAEYVKRYPMDVNGILMISPASFNEVLQDWFMNKTALMTALWGDMVTNDDGAAWAGLLAKRHVWKNPPSAKFPDPTLVNPNLKVHIVSGQYEEYVPGNLDERGLPTKESRSYNICNSLLRLFARARCTIEPGVGHYIFEHRDQDGHDVILRELLDLNDQSLDNEKELKRTAEINQPIGDVLEFARRYDREIAFRNYIDVEFKGRETLKELIQTNDVDTARKISNDYNRWIVPQRERALIENLINTKKWSPRFYASNKAEIDQIDLKKPRPSDSLINKYFALLDSLFVEYRDHRASATMAVYSKPKKPDIPAHVLERQKQKAAAQQKAS